MEQFTDIDLSIYNYSYKYLHQNFYCDNISLRTKMAKIIPD
jgi:hypothetical protein